MPSQGPRYPGAGASDNAVGTIAWVNPGNVTAEDDVAAVASFGGGGTTHYLKATDFGFTVPGTATIAGVAVTIRRKRSGGGTVVDSAGSGVLLVKGGTPQGDDKGDSVSNWAGAYEEKAYGGASDLWGLTLTPSDVNAGSSLFGVVASAYSAAGGNTADVDTIKVTVHYTTPGGDRASQTVIVGGEDLRVVEE